MELNEMEKKLLFQVEGDYQSKVLNELYMLGVLKRYGNEEQMETYAVLREAFLSGETGSVEQISAFKKSVAGRVIPKSERERLELFERMLHSMMVVWGACIWNTLCYIQW